jgi:catecholate siderophore receptor
MRIILNQDSVLALALCAAAVTAPSARAEEAEAPGDEILVVGSTDGYLASQSATALKTDTPLIDVPQTITIVTRQRLEDQASHSIADVLRYVPGITIGQGEGNRDQITLRGQNTSADFFLDGVRDDVQYYRGLYNVDRVEVLKGPYALIFGRGGGGGIINRVQKTPVEGRLFGGARASANSFGAWDLSGDVNAPVGEKAALRLNATYEEFAGHRDFYAGHRSAVNPYLAAHISERWSLGLSYEYVRDDRVSDRGVPSIATTAGEPNAPLTGFDKQFFGIPGINRSRLDAHIAKLRFDGELADNLKFSSTLLYGYYDKIYLNAFAAGPASSRTGTVALDAYADPTKRQNLIAQANLIWDAQTGAIGHKVLLGLEYGDQHTVNKRFNRLFSHSNLFDLTTRIFPQVSFTTPSRDTASDVRFFSAYAQDQISLSDHFDLVAGIRYDHFRIAGTDFIPAIDRAFARTDSKVSPRLGVIYKPRESMSFYASYSQSFLPRSGDQFVSLTVTQENLAPEKFTNFELGAKWDIRPNLNLSLAAFRLDRSNATTPDPADVLNTINVGVTRTEGIELALTGRILPQWQVSAGYTWQNARLKDNGSVRLSQVPEHQIALWNRFDLTSQLGIGLGMVHQSSQFAANRTAANTTRLPGFTRFDAAFYLKASGSFDVQVNVENLLDTRYFSDAHNNNNISPGAPINARLTARVKF